MCQDNFQSPRDEGSVLGIVVQLSGLKLSNENKASQLDICPRSTATNSISILIATARHYGILTFPTTIRQTICVCDTAGVTGSIDRVTRAGGRQIVRTSPRPTFAGSRNQIEAVCLDDLGLSNYSFHHRLLAVVTPGVKTEKIQRRRLGQTAEHSAR